MDIVSFSRIQIYRLWRMWHQIGGQMRECRSFIEQDGLFSPIQWERCNFDSRRGKNTNCFTVLWWHVVDIWERMKNSGGERFAVCWKNVLSRIVWKATTGRPRFFFQSRSAFPTSRKKKGKNYSWEFMPLTSRKLTHVLSLTRRNPSRNWEKWPKSSRSNQLAFPCRK